MAEANTCEWEKGEGICQICGKNGVLSQLWYYPTFMNGDAELEMQACSNDHAKEKSQAYQKLKESIGPSDKEREAQWKANDDANILEQIERLEQAGYKVEKKNSHYQVRINGKLDLYPRNRRYHDLASNRRGDYKNMFDFIVKFFQ
jgi:hypothetical protein